MMRAAVLPTPGPPEVLKIEKLPIPTPREGEVLIRVEAIGLNRFELYSRQGHWLVMAITLPQILGLERVGVVESCPGNDFAVGEGFATCMGGMGRTRDEGYAEYHVAPVEQVQALGFSESDEATERMRLSGKY